MPNFCSLCRHGKTIIRDINNISYGGNDTIFLGNSITSINISEIENNNFLKGITWGGKWTNLKNNTIKWTINYGGIQNSVNVYNDPNNEVSLINISENIKNYIRTLINDLSELININFEEVETVTDIQEITLSVNFIPNQFSFYGLACPPWVAEDFNTQNDYTDFINNITSVIDDFWASGNIYMTYQEDWKFNKGSFFYAVLIHELGHAMGLAHPHDTGGSSHVYEGVVSPFGSLGTYNTNVHPLTVMSYNDLGDSPYTPNTLIDNGFMGTYGPIDTYVLQLLYGKNETITNNNIYMLSEQNYWKTIFDNDGVDTLDATGISSNVIIDIRDSSLLEKTDMAGIALTSIDNIFGGFTIAKGTIIENIIDGSGNDTIIGNNVDNTITLTGGSDCVDGKTGSDTVVINRLKEEFTITVLPIPSYISLTDNIDTIILKNCEFIEFSDQKVIISELKQSNTSNNNFLEYGKISVNNSWQTISLTNTYTEPIIITSDPTYNDNIPATVRIRNISSNSFQIRIQEPRYETDNHNSEDITYIVGEKGSWNIENNYYIEFNKIDTNRLSSRGFNNIEHISDFKTAPIVFPQIQTYNGSDWVVTRVRNITRRSFDITMQEEERLNSGGHLTETIGWLSISSGSLLTESIIIENTIKTGMNVLYNYNHIYDIPPYLLSKVVSYNGPDTVNTRILSNTTSSTNIELHEEKSRDQETYHTIENIAIMVFYGNGTLGVPMEQDYSVIITDETKLNELIEDYHEDWRIYFSLDIGEKKYNLDELCKIWVYEYNELSNEYKCRMYYKYTDLLPVNPESDNTFYWNALATFNANTNIWNYILESGNGINGENIPLDGDNNPYYTIDSDGLPIDDGNTYTLIYTNIKSSPITTYPFEYSSHNIDFNWTTVSFDTKIEPVIITTIQTTNNSNPLSVRIRNISSSSFEMKLQHPNYINSIGVSETVGYIVGEKGLSAYKNGFIEFGKHDTNYLSSRGFSRVNLLGSYTSQPVILTHTQTYNGPDWIVTRTRNISTSDFYISMQEEERLNNGGHYTETLGYMAMSNNIENIENNVISYVNNNQKEYKYVNTYTKNPLIFCNLSSFNGSDTAYSRLSNISTSSFDVSIVEEKSRDTEIYHINETVDCVILD